MASSWAEEDVDEEGWIDVTGYDFVALHDKEG